MTADAAEIVRLAERVEQATGPDRELDAAIDRLFNKRPAHGDYDENEHAFWRISDAWSGLLVRTDGFARGSFCAAFYTASLDAGMSLVPEGHDTQMNLYAGREGVGACVVSPLKRIGLPRVHAYTPALALTAAALRARAASALSDGDKA